MIPVKSFDILERLQGLMAKEDMIDIKYNILDSGDTIPIRVPGIKVPLHRKIYAIANLSDKRYSIKYNILLLICEDVVVLSAIENIYDEKYVHTYDIVRSINKIKENLRHELLQPSRRNRKEVFYVSKYNIISDIVKDIRKNILIKVAGSTLSGKDIACWMCSEYRKGVSYRKAKAALSGLYSYGLNIEIMHHVIKTNSEPSP